MALQRRTTPPLCRHDPRMTFCMIACLGLHAFFLPLVARLVVKPQEPVNTISLVVWLVPWIAISTSFWCWMFWEHGLSAGYHPSTWIDRPSIPWFRIAVTWPGFLVSVALLTLFYVLYRLREHGGEQRILVEVLPDEESTNPGTAGRVKATEATHAQFIELYESAYDQARARAIEEVRAAGTALAQAQTEFKIARAWHEKTCGLLRSLSTVTRLAEALTSAHQNLARARADIFRIDGRDAPTAWREKGSRMFSALLKHPSVRSLTIYGNRLTIGLDTIFVVHKGRRYEIGDFCLMCALSPPEFWSRCLRATNPAYKHPFGASGNTCFGTATKELTAFLIRGELVSFVDLAVHMLTKPNPPVMGHWKEVPYAQARTVPRPPDGDR